MLIIDNLVFWGGGSQKLPVQHEVTLGTQASPAVPHSSREDASYSPYFSQSQRQSASCLGAADAHLCDSSTLVLDRQNLARRAPAGVS